MPRSAWYERDDSGELRSLTSRRSHPYIRPVSASPSGRPSRSTSRPASGRMQYGGFPVPGYSAIPSRRFEGVIETQMPGGILRHAFFVCNHGGVNYLFNANDYDAWKPGLPNDGSDSKKYEQHQRPMMERFEPLEPSWDPKQGECCEFAQNLSQFWHHSAHQRYTREERSALFTHMVSVCCGARTTREWADLLWRYGK
jgi:hypothetical protein